MKTGINGIVAFIDGTADYKPGDMPPKEPSSYLEWTAWAEVQYKAGLKQVECVKCGKWRTPQELSGEVFESQVFRRDRQHRMHPVTIREVICTACAAEHEVKV